MTGWQLAAVGCSVLSVAVAFVLWAPATYRLVERGPWWLVVLAPAAPLAVAVLLAGRAGDIDPYIAYPLAGLLAVAGGPCLHSVVGGNRTANLSFHDRATNAHRRCGNATEIAHDG